MLDRKTDRLRSVAFATVATALTLTSGCSTPTEAKTIPTPTTRPDAPETPCSEETKLEHKTPDLYKKIDGLTIRGYDVDATQRNARILVATEPGVKNVGVDESISQLDLSVIIQSRPQTGIVPVSGFRYIFATDTGEEFVFSGFEAPLVGFSSNACNLLDLTITNRMPKLKVNGKVRVSSRIPM